MPVLATWDQDSFQWYADTGGEGTGAKGAVNSNPTDLAPGTQYRLRYLIQETAGSSSSETPVFELEYRVDPAGGTSFGSWLPIDSDDSYFTAVSSANVTDGGTTTQQIGAGTFNDGEFSYVDATARAPTNAMAATAGNDEYECEWGLNFATAATGANFEFRVTRDTGTTLDTYTRTTQVVTTGELITLVPDALAVTGGTLSIIAEQEARITLASQAIVVTGGTLGISQAVATEVTLTPQTLTITGGTLGIVAENEATISLTPQALTITAATMTISQAAPVSAPAATPAGGGWVGGRYSVRSYDQQAVRKELEALIEGPKKQAKKVAKRVVKELEEKQVVLSPELVRDVAHALTPDQISQEFILLENLVTLYRSIELNDEEATLLLLMAA